MCTAIIYKNKGAYFGRTLDVEREYGERVVVLPRNMPLRFCKTGDTGRHYAMIGMGLVQNNFPLFFDAANEHGLAMAGLNFPDNAYYFPERADKDNVASFELIPFILCRCRNVAEAGALLEHVNICDIHFSDSLPSSPLHWMIADRECALSVECTRNGLAVYENKVGVLTNNPPFAQHLTRLCDYMTLSPEPPDDNLGLGTEPYSRGMGAMGLPGDLSSASRFVRAAFTKHNSVCDDDGEEIAQFFHILSSVEQTRGCVRLSDGSLERTSYTSCIDLERGIYYYSTYENRRVCGVGMRACELDAHLPYLFEPVRYQDVFMHSGE